MPKSPVALLYVSGQLAESEVRLILPLKVLKSVEERAPETVVEARARARPVPEIERPLEGVVMKPTLLLKVL